MYFSVVQSSWFRTERQFFMRTSSISILKTADSRHTEMHGLQVRIRVVWMRFLSNDMYLAVTRQQQRKPQTSHRPYDGNNMVIFSGSFDVPHYTGSFMFHTTQVLSCRRLRGGTDGGMFRILFLLL